MKRLHSIEPESIITIKQKTIMFGLYRTYSNYKHFKTYNGVLWVDETGGRGRRWSQLETLGERLDDNYWYRAGRNFIEQRGEVLDISNTTFGVSDVPLG